MTDFIQFLSQLDPSWIYAAIFLIAYIENIFPPSPSDVAVVFGGALAAMGKGNVVLTLLFCTAGSTCGFLTMYAVGKWFGRKIVDEGRLPFLQKESVIKVEQWFVKYGFWLIIGNRFLAGTRAVVSFFAGVADLELYKTTLLSFISALAWYGILVYGGYSLGSNWREILGYMQTYSRIIMLIMLVAALAAIVRYYFIRRRQKQQND